MNILSHILGPQSWGPIQGTWATSAGWRVTETNRRLWIACPPFRSRMHILTGSQLRKEKADWITQVAALFPMASLAHVPAWAEWTLQPHVLYITVPHWRKRRLSCDLGKNSALRKEEAYLSVPCPSTHSILGFSALWVSFLLAGIPSYLQASLPIGGAVSTQESTVPNSWLSYCAHTESLLFST